MKLLYGDMRTLDVPEKVDILVSELLGSFGDNELSPECLDGGMRFLKRKVSFVSTSLKGLRLTAPEVLSGWPLDTVVVHGVHRPDLVLEAVQRDKGGQGL